MRPFPAEVATTERRETDVGNIMPVSVVVEVTAGGGEGPVMDGMLISGRVTFRLGEP